MTLTASDPGSTHKILFVMKEMLPQWCWENGFSKSLSVRRMFDPSDV